MLTRNAGIKDAEGIMLMGKHAKGMCCVPQMTVSRPERQYLYGPTSCNQGQPSSRRSWCLMPVIAAYSSSVKAQLVVFSMLLCTTPSSVSGCTASVNQLKQLSC